MTVAQRLPRFAHPSKESRMMLEAVFKPVVLVLESDQDPSWLPMARNDDLAIGGQAQKTRQVVFHGSQSDFTARWRRALRATFRLLPS